jgi:hypothetical protein
MSKLEIKYQKIKISAEGNVALVLGFAIAGAVLIATTYNFIGLR